MRKYLDGKTILNLVYNFFFMVIEFYNSNFIIFLKISIFQLIKKSEVICNLQKHEL